MQIEQAIVSVNGDTTAQAIQLRMRVAGQNFVSGGKLVVFDATGLNPITVVDPTTNVANGAVGDHVLIASATFPSHTTPMAVPDFTMANLIPASYFAAGSLCWESNAGIVMWRLSWGGAAYTGLCTGSTINDVDGNFCPAFGGAIPSTCASALQFQGTATDLSTNNDADYLLIGSPIVFSNNARASFTVIPPLPTITITAPDPSASEVPATDTGKFSIRRAGCTDSDLDVFYSVSGTATNGMDYRRLSRSCNHSIRCAFRRDRAPTDRRHDFRTRRDGHSNIVARSGLHYRSAQHRHSYDPQQRVTPGKVSIA